MSKENSNIDQAAGPRRAGDFVAYENDRYPPSPIFDAFWREGELALMFGPVGAGKSLLAMQVADALGRGRPIEGFAMPKSRRKVLYVDLRLSDRQFAERYSYRSPVPRIGSILKACKFAENLYRSRPGANEELCEWLAGQVGEYGFNVVIIDDLTALKQTNDGVREMLAAIYELKKLCVEKHISILAICGSEAARAGRAVSEQDLKRSGVLCGVADSVFAVGRGRSDGRYIIQTRSRNTAIRWTENNAPTAHIARAENGWPGLVFDERFSLPVDPQTCEAICRVRAMRRAGITYRAIAAELGIAKSRAARLFQKWTPEMGGEEFEAGCEQLGAEPVVPAAEETPMTNSQPPEPQEWELAGFEKPVWVDVENEVPLKPPPAPNSLPLHGPQRVSVYDLRRETDRGGTEIFVQAADADTGEPKIWFKFDRKGKKIRCERMRGAVYVSHLDDSHYV